MCLNSGKIINQQNTWDKKKKTKKERSKTAQWKIGKSHETRSLPIDRVPCSSVEK